MKLTDCRACGAAGTPPEIAAGGQKGRGFRGRNFCPPAFARFAGEPLIFRKEKR